LLVSEDLRKFLWRDACLAQAKLLLEVPTTSEEVGDAVGGVGEPCTAAGLLWKETSPQNSPWNDFEESGIGGQH
jgi:hypothetical protein